MSTFSDYMIIDSIELTTLPIVSKLITFLYYIDYIYVVSRLYDLQI